MKRRSGLAQTVAHLGIPHQRREVVNRAVQHSKQQDGYRPAGTGKIVRRRACTMQWLMGRTLPSAQLACSHAVERAQGRHMQWSIVHTRALQQGRLF